MDRTPAENPEPPSAYCEVHINDRLIYRTRTKQMTPLPYFNAVSERFLRDWRLAKVTIVVRDERDREHGESLTVNRADFRSNSWYRCTQSEGAFPEYKPIHPVVPPCWRSGLGSNPNIPPLETDRYCPTTQDIWVRDRHDANQVFHLDRLVEPLRQANFGSPRDRSRQVHAQPWRNRYNVHFPEVGCGRL